MEDRVKRRRLVDIETDAFGRVRLQFENARGQINDSSSADILKDKHEMVDHIRGMESTFIGIDESTHFRDAVLYGQGASWTPRVPVQDPLTKFKDHELVMELLKRGYAAMKLPADGGPPEVLCGKSDS